MRLYLIRHPRPAVAEGVCYGATDLPLHEDPGAVAERLRGAVPAGLPVYSSPLRRCRELADCLHAEPVHDDRLREMHFGCWEMQRWDALPRTELDAWAADPLGYAPPGGESPAALLARVAEFIAELGVTGHTSAVLVTHAGVIKAAHGLLEPAGSTAWMQLSFGYASVTLLTLPPAERYPAR